MIRNEKDNLFECERQTTTHRRKYLKRDESLYEIGTLTNDKKRNAKNI